jgi:hypothetical protein
VGLNRSIRHSRAGGNPVNTDQTLTNILTDPMTRWIPACAGMMGIDALQFSFGISNPRVPSLQKRMNNEMD